jgi:heat shock protein HtpX
MSILIRFWLVLCLVWGLFLGAFAASETLHVDQQTTPVQAQKSLRVLKNELLQDLQQKFIDLDSKICDLKREKAFFASDRNNPRVAQIERALKIFTRQCDDVQEKTYKLRSVFELKKRPALFNKNKIKAFGLTSLFAVGSGVGIYYFCKKIAGIQDPAEKKKMAIFASVIAGGFLLLHVLAYFFSEDIALAVSDAEELDEKKYAHVYKMAEELAKNAGIVTPNLCIIPDKSVNAFAAGRGPSHSSVAFTQGLLDLLNEDELRCVFGHEISHIRNYDVLWHTVMLLCSLPLYFVADKVKYSHNQSKADVYNNDVTFNDVVYFLVFKYLGTCMKLGLQLSKLFISRSDEYRADQEGGILGQDPAAMARALDKLRSNNEVAVCSGVKSNNILEFAFTIPSASEQLARNKRSRLGAFISWIDELFATHPRTSKRVEAMEELDKVYRKEIEEIVGV